MPTFREQLVRAFHETGSFKWDPSKGFTLASGHVSPFYVDCRALMAHPSARRLVGQLAHGALMGVEIDCLGGLEIGAISIATTISDFAYAADPKREWRKYFRENKPLPEQVSRLVIRLHDAKREVDVIAAIEAAILNGQAQTWMYEVLQVRCKSRVDRRQILSECCSRALISLRSMSRTCCFQRRI